MPVHEINVNFKITLKQNYEYSNVQTDYTRYIQMAFFSFRVQVIRQVCIS